MSAAIETLYAGHVFRSRLEARWAAQIDLTHAHPGHESEVMFFMAGGVQAEALRDWGAAHQVTRWTREAAR